MQFFKIPKLLFLLISIITIGCKRDIDLKYIKSYQWSYQGGFKVGEGDIMVFEDSIKLFQLKADTIYYKNHPRAIITELNKSSYMLKLRSIQQKEYGEYLILGHQFIE